MVGTSGAAALTPARRMRRLPCGGPPPPSLSGHSTDAELRVRITGALTGVQRSE